MFITAPYELLIVAGSKNFKILKLTDFRPRGVFPGGE